MVAACTLPATAAGDDISVGTLADQFDAAPAGGCSLREAVQTANTDVDFGGCTQTPPVSEDDRVLLNVAAGGAPYLLSRVVGDANNDDNNDGDLDVTETLRIQGNGAADDVIQANGFAVPNIDRALHVLAGDLTVEDLGITKGNLTGSGGGAAIFVPVTTAANLVRANDVVFDDNDVAAEFGGAIEKENGGTLVIFDSTFVNNSVTGAAGGAIDTNATVSIFDSTFTNNSAVAAGGGGSAIAIYGDVTATGGGVLENVTVSGNQADSEGALLLDTGSGGITLRHTTIAQNTSVQPGFGAAIHDASAVLGGNFTLVHSILNLNTANGVASSCNGAAGDYITGGHNVTDTPAAQCDLNTAAPDLDFQNTLANLGPLQDNGGTTETRAIAFGSAAVDIVPVADCTAIDPTPVDQRGVARPIGPACDAGAFEAALPPPTPPQAQQTQTEPFDLAAALRKCKKKFPKSKKRKRCKRRARARARA